jgi:hypothetical protein
MTVHHHPRRAPQFKLVLSDKGGIRILFNGTAVEHATLIEVSTTAALDDVVTSRLTIELRGEPIPVETEWEQ